MALAAPLAPAQTLTYEQYLVEGEVPGRYDIINGVRVFMPSPKWKHQRVADNITELLRRYERESANGLAVSAPMDVMIRPAPLQTRQPDVLFISRARLEEGGIPEEGPLTVAPELIVEVLSPSETPRSLWDKIEDFRAIGVSECWIAGPDSETVQVLRLTLERAETAAVYAYGQTLRSEVFPELTLPVAEIFAE